MHIHTIHANAGGDALANAQAAESAMAQRRARDLRSAARKLDAGAFSQEFENQVSTVPFSPIQARSELKDFGLTESHSSLNPVSHWA